MMALLSFTGGLFVGIALGFAGTIVLIVAGASLIDKEDV